MLAGRRTRVKAERCDEHGIKEVVFEPVDPGEKPWFYSPPTNASFGDGPRDKRDPLEEVNVELKESTLPGGGEGVFAVRDIANGSVVCFYSGYLYRQGRYVSSKLYASVIIAGFHFRNREEIDLYGENYIDNETRTIEERIASKKYSLSTSILR